MIRPDEYKYIRAWGRMMGSYDYYIKNAQRKASEEEAPTNAIYKGVDTEGERWFTFEDITSKETRMTVSRLVE